MGKLVKPGLNNKVKIYHSFDKCENCQVKGGKDILKAELQKIEALNDKKLKFLSSLKENNNNGGELEKLQYDKEKRQFLGSIFKSFAKIPETIVTTVIGFETEREGENINSSDEKLSERKELLLKSIAIDPNLKEKIMISLPHIKEGCQFCKVCSILCPQKALIQQEEGNGCKITLDKKLCNGCQLCVDVCYHKAIELKLSNIKELDGAVFVLAEGYEFICSECGMPYKSSVEDKCVNCK